MGSFSELAAFEFFSPDVRIVPCETFSALFDAVVEGEAAYGMAPVENSLAGSIDPVWDLLLSRRPFVAGELYLRIEHCLIGNPGAELDRVRRIYSHQQALAQCQEFIGGLDGVVQEEVYDTAGAVKMIKKRGNGEEAAIASAQAAIDYQMQVLAENIQTNHHNFTRFLVIADRAVEVGEAELKSTVVFKADLSAVSATELMATLSRKGIAVSKLETRKCLGEPWRYLVYLDLEGDVAEGPIDNALKELKSQVLEVSVVGSYPSGTHSEARLHRQ